MKFDSVHDLLQKEVDRKDFLRFVGIGLLGVVGILSLTENLRRALNHGLSSSKQSASHGYGSTPYGK